MTFKEFQLDQRILEGLEATGFENATPIQEQAIPLVLKGHDIIASAQTGTGKTAAFLLPVIHKILQEQYKDTSTLIIAPTRELAQQIDQQIEGLAYFTSVSSAPVYGGGDGSGWDTQKNAMLRGSDIITATPGRLLSLLNTNTFRFNHLKHLILDEADRMLDMGFLDDILRIMKFLPEERQTLLFSATMPPKIRQLANRILKDPVAVSIAISKPAEGINQQAYVVYDNQKEALVRHILQDEKFSSVIIFASTKEKVKNLNHNLKKAGLACKGFHSDLEQDEREEIMRLFRGRKVRILVGTDVISRGIDVEGISLVINYDVPSDPEDYIHRIGRTARAATEGTAITFISEKDQAKFLRIETLTEKEVPKMPLPAELGEGPAYNPTAKFHDTPRKGNWRKPQRNKGNSGNS
jgi:ATP-dependent RNA helicase RhlE